MKSVTRTIVILFLVLFVSGCQSFTLRTSPDAYRTGRVLEEGKYKIVTNSMLILMTPMPGFVWRVSGGLPYDMEATVGWGVHGMIVGPEDEGEESDVLHGPELFLTKNLVNLNDHFYLSASLGTEMNLIPEVDASIIGGFNFGWYPIDWFVVFGHAQGLYHTKGYLTPQVGLGLGLDGPFILKIAAYTHFKEDSIELLDGTFFWPFYYGLQVGFSF